MNDAFESEPSYESRVAPADDKLMVPAGDEPIAPSDEPIAPASDDRGTLANGNPGAPPDDLGAPAGRLPAEARRALVELMRQGVVVAETRRLVFDALCTHRALIADHLADMYLRLLIDEPAGLVLLLSAHSSDSDGDEEDGPALISRRTLTLYDTLLLIVLRKHFLDRETAGDTRIRVDTTQIEAMMTPFLPLSGSTSGDRKKLNGAIESMKKRRVVNAVRGEAERLEISPVIRYVVNAEYLEHLLAEYRRLADEARSGQTGPASSDEPDPDSDDGDDE